MTVLIVSLIFLITVFMWPDTIYKISGNLELIRKMTGFMIGILLMILIVSSM